MVKCLLFKFEIEIEFIFGILVLYDVWEKKKILENFYFDLNLDFIKGLFWVYGIYFVIFILVCFVIFFVIYFLFDIFLVIKLEKVF